MFRGIHSLGWPMVRVTVSMKPVCHQILKMYAVSKGLTLSQLCYSVLEAHVRKEAHVNKHLETILEIHGFALDPDFK